MKDTSIFKKGLAVINSCNNELQLNNAYNYIVNVSKINKDVAFALKYNYKLKQLTINN